jgi:hypothetical protein
MRCCNAAQFEFEFCQLIYFQNWRNWSTLGTETAISKDRHLTVEYPNAQSIPLGVVVKRTQGVTRWAKYSWHASAVLPGAWDADWKVLRDEGGVTEYHAATLPLTLYVSDAEAYAHELMTREPSVYVVLRPNEVSQTLPWKVALVTASPYEAQDYCDSAEELVEKIPMPDGLHAWVGSFVDTYYEEETFVKRRRDKSRIDRVDDGIGDARIKQVSDVYRAPRRKEVVN